MSTTESNPREVRAAVRERYGQIAADFQPGASASCCGPSSSGCCAPDSAASDVVRLYEIPEAADLPPEVTGLSLGCGDPVALAGLQPGETVLDLGSGGGIDCFLAARRVGPTGRVIGVDMTPEMLEKARSNRERLGADNVEFRLGEIEHLPVADAEVDVILSNCVINLSTDKPQVFREAFRVLKPGGKLAVSDIVTEGQLPVEIRTSLEQWAGCVAGALNVKDYLEGLQNAGFVDVAVERVYLDRQMIDSAVEQLDLADARQAVSDEALYQSVFSAKVTARKPAR